MREKLWNQIGVYTRRLTPFFITLSLVIFSVTPIHASEYPSILPLLPLMGVFHWAVYKPESLPAYGVFFIGLLQDILSGAPIGVNCAVLLLVYGAVISQHRFFFGKSFLLVWVGFGIVLIGASFLTWAFMSVLNNTLIGTTTIYFQYILTLGFYPVLAWCFLRCQKHFLKMM